MDKRRDWPKRVLLSVLAVLLSVCFLVLAFRIFTLMVQYCGRVDTSEEDGYAYRNGGRPEYLVDGKWYIQKARTETFLLIGIDKYEAAIKTGNSFRNNEQADALFLLAVDRENESYSILHINRDTMANIRMLDINGDPYSSFVGQLALSHTYGSGREDSCENTVWSVSDYLYGLQIDHFASVSMDAVAILNDSIGGVTLTVSDDMTTVDKTLAHGKTVTLSGEQALTYIRARQGLADSSNLARMERQRQYVTAFLEQAKSAASENDGRVSDMLLSISDYLVSDMTADELLSLTDVLEDYSFAKISPIAGEARKGVQFMEFYADEAALQRLVLETFYTEK